MEIREAIEILKCNYPDACYSMLREAVDIAISVLETQGKTNLYNTTTAPNSYAEQNCASRLPCGVCMITGNRCPQTWSVQPTWITTVGSTPDASSVTTAYNAEANNG